MSKFGVGFGHHS